MNYKFKFINRVVNSNTGRLGIDIALVELADGKLAYLKTASRSSPEDLCIEKENLLWLQSRLPVPQVLDYSVNESHCHLLLSEIEGAAAHTIDPSCYEKAIEQIACGLKSIQQVNVERCPFPNSIFADIEIIKRLLTAGSVDEAKFKMENDLAPKDALALLERLAGQTPLSETVLSHGDLCLPNILLNDELEISGFIDWGLARIADPVRDCAMLEESIRFNYGDKWVDEFYRYFSPRPDPQKLKLYYLADQFFTHLRIT